MANGSSARIKRALLLQVQDAWTRLPNPRGEPSVASPDLAARAAVAGRTDALAPAAVLRLQRTAGNAAVAAALEDDREPRSPVTEVVGRGSGRPLEAPVRQRMEASFGADFSDVRVHTGIAAAASAQAVDALAYTVGNEIVLGKDNAPDSSTHERTLAHELTHVVQQRSGPVDGTPVAGGISFSGPTDRFETAAEATADAVMGVVRVPEAGTAGAPAAGSVQRTAEPEEVQPRQGGTPAVAPVMRAPMHVMRTPLEKERGPGPRNEVMQYPDSTQTFDPYDQTLTIVYPDASGWQITFQYVNKPGEDPQAQEAQISSAEALSPIRTEALGFLASRQGTAQETEEEQQRRLERDKEKTQQNLDAWLGQSSANRAAYDGYEAERAALPALQNEHKERLKEYTVLKAEANRKGQSPPARPIPPPQPKKPAGMPAPVRTTLCNGFPREMAVAITGDPRAGGLGGMKLSDMAREGAWHTLELQPEGEPPTDLPKPGDACSLAAPGAKDQPDDEKRRLLHVSIFKSRRPGPGKLQIWTFVDGGQGVYEGRQQVRERASYFDPATGMLSATLDPAGNLVGGSWLRGWIDVDTQLKKKPAEAS